MSDFTLHTVESAPEGSKPMLDSVAKKYGFIPGLLAVQAESPAVLKGYITLSDIFGQSTLTPQEQQVVLITASVINSCEFCVAAHSYISRNITRLDGAVIEALRNQQPLPDAKLEALSQFTKAVVEARGFVSDATVSQFMAAGFDKAQVLDVILGVSLKVLSNYTNHIAETPTPEAFAGEAWKAPNKPAKQAA